MRTEPTDPDVSSAQIRHNGVTATIVEFGGDADAGGTCTGLAGGPSIAQKRGPAANAGLLLVAMGISLCRSWLLVPGGIRG
jgi:hypothetical protein